MHENEALEFVQLALEGFLERNFSYIDTGDSNVFSEYLQPFKKFIKDSSGYWVFEKSLQCIFYINEAEKEIRLEFTPKSKAIDLIEEIIDKASSRILKKSKANMVSSGMAMMPVPPPQM